MDNFKSNLASSQSLLIYIILPVFLLSLVIFNHAYRIGNSSNEFFDKSTIPLEHPAGVDYRYVYRQSSPLRNEINDYLKIAYIYPPLTAVFNLPLTFFSEDIAYNIFSIILLSLLFFTIYIAFKENPIPILDRGKNNSSFFLAIFMFTIAYSTYPLMFEVERGNCNIIAGFFSIISLYAITRRQMLLAIISLTIAVNYKVYPLILFALIFLRFGWKTLPIMIITNFLALFVLGYKGFQFFIQQLFFSHAPSKELWEGNHSLYSFLNQLKIFNNHDNLHYAFYALTLFLMIFFTIGWFRCIRLSTKNISPDKNSIQIFSGAEIGLIGMSFQLMALLPPISHDYKLVILLIPFIMLLTRSIDDFKMNELILLILFVLLSISMGFIFSLRYSIAGIDQTSYPFMMPLKTWAVFLNFILYYLISRSCPRPLRIIVTVPL